VTAASRGNIDVIEFLASSESADLFIQNFQNETVYDIAAEKGDLLMCHLISEHEQLQWTKSHSSGTTLPPPYF